MFDSDGGSILPPTGAFCRGCGAKILTPCVASGDPRGVGVSYERGTPVASLERPGLEDVVMSPTAHIGLVYPTAHIGIPADV